MGGRTPEETSQASPVGNPLIISGVEKNKGTDTSFWGDAWDVGFNNLENIYVTAILQEQYNREMEGAALTFSGACSNPDYLDWTF